jgi:tetratricopeptide (TPR) repeat protein
MSLRNRVRAIAIVVTALWAVLAFRVYTQEFGVSWVLLSALLATLVGLAIVNLTVRPYLTRLQTALAREDIPTAQREFAVLSDFFRLRGRERMKANGISILMLEERYQEALTGLQGLNIKQLGKKGSSVIRNQMAWCMTQLGEPTKAIALTQSVLAQLESIGPEYSSSAHLVLGAANFLLGKADEAVPHLEQAYTSAISSASRKATAAFYLGESYSALGKSAEAQLAYHHAVEALPNGRYGRRALERVKGIQ